MNFPLVKVFCPNGTLCSSNLLNDAEVNTAVSSRTILSENSSEILCPNKTLCVFNLPNGSNPNNTAPIAAPEYLSSSGLGLWILIIVCSMIFIMSVFVQFIRLLERLNIFSVSKTTKPKPRHQYQNKTLMFPESGNDDGSTIKNDDSAEVLSGLRRYFASNALTVPTSDSNLSNSSMSSSRESDCSSSSISVSNTVNIRE